MLQARQKGISSSSPRRVRPGLFLLLLITLSLLCSHHQTSQAEAAIPIEVGVAWQGSSIMSERVLAGLQMVLEDQAPEIQLDIRRNLTDLADLEAAITEFEGSKKAMVILRSNGVELIGKRGVHIPTFIGSTNNPVSLGVASSLSKPNPNITGVTFNLPARLKLESFRQVYPAMTRILLPVESGHPGSLIDIEETEAAAIAMGMTVRVSTCETLEDAKAAVESTEPDEVILLGIQALIMDNTGPIIASAGDRIVFSYSEQAVEQGALAGVTADDAKLGRILGTMLIDHLKRGRSLEDIPIQTDTEPRLRINYTTMERQKDRIPYAIQSLAQSEQLLESIYRSAPTGIGVTEDRVLTQVNDYILDLTGYTRDELIGKNARMLYPTQEEFDHVGEEKYRLISEFGTGSLQTRWLCKDGSICHVFLSSTPLDLQNPSAGVTFTVTDISDRILAEEALASRTGWFMSVLVLFILALLVMVGSLLLSLKRRKHTEQLLKEERKALEMLNLELNATLENLSVANRKLEDAKQEAENANRAKSQFLANMSHEIRTPMNGMMGMLQLANLSPESEEQASYLEIAQSSANTLLRILNDILDYSKMEAGTLSFACEPFSLRKAAGEATLLYEASARSNGLNLSLHIDEAVPDIVCGDEIRLRQVLANLVGNAVKFTEAGKVSVSLTLADYQESKAHIHFSVSDTGIGISEEQKNQLFQRFMQVDTSLRRRHNGTGLGLAISKRLVEGMGGEISLHSTPGKGSTFSFTLPFLPKDNNAMSN